jgi:hypothetical protein
MVCPTSRQHTSVVLVERQGDVSASFRAAHLRKNVADPSTFSMSGAVVFVATSMRTEAPKRPECLTVLVGDGISS